MASGAQESRDATIGLGPRAEGHGGWEIDAGPSAGSAEPRHLFKIEHAKLKVGLSAGRTGPRIQETFFGGPGPNLNRNLTRNLVPLLKRTQHLNSIRVSTAAGQE